MLCVIFDSGSSRILCCVCVSVCAEDGVQKEKFRILQSKVACLCRKK